MKGRDLKKDVLEKKDTSSASQGDSAQVGGDRSKPLDRRSFLKSVGAFGAAAAFVSSQGFQVAKARPHFRFVGDLTDEQLIDMQRKMLRARWYDRIVADKQAFEDGYRGYGHFACGHEGVVAGVSAALRRDDWIQGYHRSHHHGIAKGADLRGMAAEIAFKATGVNKGYGGSMHIMQKDVGMLGEDGIVGPGGVIGAGAAFGMKARGTDQVAVTYGGDAHASTPFFQMGLNNAARHKLPFIYVVERNGYQIQQPWRGEAYRYPGVTFTAQSHLDSITPIGEAYKVPSYQVDGMNALEVYEVAKAAVDRARAGDGPTLIEAMCYRYYDHFGTGGVREEGTMGAFGLPYRSDREVRHWLARDPIPMLRQTLINWGVMTDAEADELEADVRGEVEEAFDFADQSPVPDARDGIKHVYREGVVLPRQLADCPLYVEGWVEGTPVPANFPEFSVGRLPASASKVVIDPEAV